MMLQNDALAGIRIVDFSWIIAGPQCTRILADFGAEVIRVENEQRLDSIRFTIPFAEDQPGVNRSGFFNNHNRSKLSITLNARHPEGMELLRRLIAISDIVVENYSSRVMESWGLGYEEQRKLRPDIIYISVSGFGHTGRNHHYTTWGPTAQALSGLTFMSGLPGKPPAGWGYSFMDHTAGYYAAMAVLMALHHRNRTGRGQRIDMSQVETGIVLTGPTLLDFTVNGRPYRRKGNPPGNRSDHPAVAPHNTYRCQGDDRWCVISVFTDGQWQALRLAMGDPDWAKDARFADNGGRVRHQDDLDRCIEEWTRQRTPEEAMLTLQAAGVPAGAVQTCEDKVKYDPQLRARGFFPELDHPELGHRPFEGLPIHLSRSPGHLRSAAPLLGQHNRYVYQELLGIPDGEYERLVSEGVI